MTKPILRKLTLLLTHTIRTVTSFPKYQKNIDESDTNAFRYCGEYYDKETDTVYLRARYYSPSSGRFISRDSVAGNANDPLSLNLYTYCHNNPILNFDPSGHSIWSSVKKGWNSVKQWGKDRVDDWKTAVRQGRYLQVIQKV